MNMLVCHNIMVLEWPDGPCYVKSGSEMLMPLDKAIPCRLSRIYHKVLGRGAVFLNNVHGKYGVANDAKHVH